jgi:hypothetical protein
MIDPMVVAQAAAQSALSCSRDQVGDACFVVLVFARGRMCFLSKHWVAVEDDGKMIFSLVAVEVGLAVLLSGISRPSFRQDV